MPRVKRGTKRNDRRKKILKRASGYFLTKSKKVKKHLSGTVLVSEADKRKVARMIPYA